MNQWAHVICVNWTPELWYTDDAKTKVAGTVPESKRGIACLKCKKKEGSII